jgi:hypothetical protein
VNEAAEGRDRPFPTDLEPPVRLGPDGRPARPADAGGAAAACGRPSSVAGFESCSVGGRGRNLSPAVASAAGSVIGRHGRQRRRVGRRGRDVIVSAVTGFCRASDLGDGSFGRPAAFPPVASATDALPPPTPVGPGPDPRPSTVGAASRSAGARISAVRREPRASRRSISARGSSTTARRGRGHRLSGGRGAAGVGKGEGTSPANHAPVSASRRAFARPSSSRATAGRVGEVREGGAAGQVRASHEEGRPDVV